MGFKDRLKDAAQKSAEMAKQGAEAAKGLQAEPQAGKEQAEAIRAEQPAPEVTPAAQSGVLLVAKSHDEGRNATVQVFSDRIERRLDRALGSLSRARQDTEVIPIRSVSSV